MNQEFMKAALTGDQEFMRAALAGDADKVRLLLSDSRVDPTAGYNFGMRWASENGHTDVVKLLLVDPRVDPAADNNFPIRIASNKGRGDVVKLLLSDPRVNPAADNNYAIRISSEFGHTEVVRLLLSDSRVDWRYAIPEIKNELIKAHENKLKNILITSYSSIERTSPQVKYGQKVKSAVPKEIIKRIAYMGLCGELFVAKNDVPPVKLVALANLLKVHYDDQMGWDELCDRVKHGII